MTSQLTPKLNGSAIASVRTTVFRFLHRLISIPVAAAGIVVYEYCEYIEDNLLLALINHYFLVIHFDNEVRFLVLTIIIQTNSVLTSGRSFLGMMRNIYCSLDSILPKDTIAETKMELRKGPFSMGLHSLHNSSSLINEKFS